MQWFPFDKRRKALLGSIVQATGLIMTISTAAREADQEITTRKDRSWIRPQVLRLAAGSAEDGINGTPDAITNPS
jgi:hypothetical protein